MEMTFDIPDVVLDPADFDFASMSDDELRRWIRFDVVEAITEYTRRHGALRPSPPARGRLTRQGRPPDG